MKTTDLISKVVEWAEAIRPEGTGDSTMSLTGSIIEIRNRKMTVLKRERTAIMVCRVDADGEVCFTSEQYGGSNTEITQTGNKVIFSWVDKNRKKEVSYPKPDETFHDKIVEIIERKNDGREAVTKRISTADFDDLTRDIQFTTIEDTLDGFILIQQDPRGIEIKVAVPELKTENKLRNMF